MAKFAHMLQKMCHFVTNAHFKVFRFYLIFVGLKFKLLKFDFTKMRKGLRSLCSCGGSRHTVPEDEKVDDVAVDEEDGASKGGPGVAASKVRVSCKRECRARDIASWFTLHAADLRR